MAMTTAEQVRAAIEPALAPLGLVIEDVTATPAGKRRLVRVLVDPDIADLDSTGLAVVGVDVALNTTTADLTSIDAAITTISTARSNLGAIQNRFDHTVKNLNVAVENLSASESRIRDTDMASEMVQFTRAQILNQAGTAMLAQANQLPQSVLQLLQG